MARVLFMCLLLFGWKHDLFAMVERSKAPRETLTSRLPSCHTRRSPSLHVVARRSELCWDGVRDKMSAAWAASSGTRDAVLKSTCHIVAAEVVARPSMRLLLKPADRIAPSTSSCMQVQRQLYVDHNQDCENLHIQYSVCQPHGRLARS
jgi:hypothetical protein